MSTIAKSDFKGSTDHNDAIFNQLASYTRVAKYAMYLPEKKRRETWEEQCSRVTNMHKTMYAKYLPKIEKYIDMAHQAMVNKEILGSQRALQFGGPSILGKNTRIYNCAATYINRVRAFQEVMFVLMCGGGVGFSVQKHHVTHLPEIKKITGTKKVFESADSIEGWADCIGVLMSSYFEGDVPFPEYQGRDVVFDLSKIRPKGSPIANCNGVAPGAKPLEKALIKISAIIEKALKEGNKTLKPIHVYDIIMHISDAVLSGGVRRSACISIFSPDDKEMLAAKTGSWFIENPQRARSNNSALLIRDEVSYDEFYSLFSSVRQFGEPGFIWADNKETLFNPCFPDDVMIDTDEGEKPIKDLIGVPFNANIDGESWPSTEKGFFKTGENQQVYELKALLTNGQIYQSVEATDNHRFMTTDGNWVELKDLKKGDRLKYTYTNQTLVVDTIRPTRKVDVYDCTIPEKHAFSANGFYAHNCVEACLYGHDEKGNSGWQLCNLCEINMKIVESPSDFYKACESAAVLGTLQAGYTDFGYLGKVTQSIVEREALLGISMTGMMDSPDIAFDEKVLTMGAKIIKETNEKIAALIKINPSSRLTCIKPAGTTSCILGTASGIHPRHSLRYMRRVQSNKDEKPLQYYKTVNPASVEESVWSANKTDDVITFLCKSSEKSMLKADVSALDLLKKVKLVQEFWCMPGTVAERNVKPFLHHNVSNTINVDTHEWDEVAKYIYENRKHYTGISLLGKTGDKDYQQAPFQQVLSHEELAKEYGPASVFASGLIIHAHNAFNNNLYDACSCLLGFGEKLDDVKFDDKNLGKVIERAKNTLEKKSWISRAKKFANNYFDGDLNTMIYCLKDVNAWHIWCSLKRTLKPVDWKLFTEDTDNTNFKETLACAGGQCVLSRF